MQLTIAIDRYTVPVGGEIAFSFTSSQDGYVTLWNVGTSGRVSRIFPNEFGGDMQVALGISTGGAWPSLRASFSPSPAPAAPMLGLDKQKAQYKNVLDGARAGV